MSAENVIRTESDGSLSFGDHTLKEKTKVENFQHNGDSYKVKTYATMTKLEKNDMFVYESVPGTTVTNFTESESGMDFTVSGSGDAQIILGLSDDTTYHVYVAGEDRGELKTNLGGKLDISAMLGESDKVEIKITK